MPVAPSRARDGAPTDRFDRILIHGVWIFALALAALWIVVARWASLDVTGAPLDERARTVLFRALRASLDDRPAAAPMALPGARAIGYAHLHCAGATVSSIPVRVAGGELEGAGFAQDAAVASLDVHARRACRISLELLRGRAPIVTAFAPAFALSLIAGVDGLGLDFGGREVLIFPHELLREGLYAGRPIPTIDLEAGLDTQAALRHLALRAGASADAWRRTPHHLFRFRVETWAEPAAAPTRAATSPSPLFRGHEVSGPPLAAESLRAAALAGARYLARHLHPSGRFNYQYDTARDQELPDADDYSLPRHAGAASFLAQAAGAFHDDALRDAAARSIEWLRAHRPEACDRSDRACAAHPEAERADLGSSALALLAAVEYQRATADPRFLPWARRLARFALSMQKPDGDFAHLYDLAASRRDESTRLLYYSGEATFALAKLAALPSSAEPDAPPGLDRAALAAAVDRALDHLTGAAYDFFAGRFFYGEDHWTCLALDAAWDLLADVPGGAARRERYADFCEGFARWNDRFRFQEGEGPVREQPDLAGSYGFTPLLPPHPTPVGSRSEALISIHRIALRRGHDAAAREIAAAVRAGLRFLLAHQIRPDGALLMARPDAADGGFLQSDAIRTVRVDFVQHAGSALLRASDEPPLSTE